jgi:hypothetical protein
MIGKLNHAQANVLLTLWLPASHAKPADSQPIVVNIPPQTMQLNIPPSKKDGLDYAIVVCNLVLATVGIGSLIALRNQLKAVRRIERAILIPVWEQEIWLSPETDGETKHTFQWKYKNEGKTAGFLRDLCRNAAA